MQYTYITHFSAAKFAKYMVKTISHYGYAEGIGLPVKSDSYKHTFWNNSASISDR